MTVPSDPPSAGPPPAGDAAGAAVPPAKRSVSTKQIVVALVVLVVLLVGALVAVTAGGSEKAAATEVRTEPVSTSGANPFMPSVGTDEPDVTPPPDSAGTFPGDTPGLYGGTMREGSCDAEALIRFLEANADKAAAFATVLGIRVADIRSYVSTLTPVTLRTDTAVTNHGFSNGRATTIPAILQAGTAVLIDKYGTPRVKCYCGNPLTPPTRYKDPVYYGPRWPKFEPTSITIIEQTTVIIDIFILIDIDTGEPFSRPAGTDGAADGPAPGDASTTTTTTTTTTLPTFSAPTAQPNYTPPPADHTPPPGDYTPPPPPPPEDPCAHGCEPPPPEDPCAHGCEPPPSEDPCDPDNPHYDPNDPDCFIL